MNEEFSATIENKYDQLENTPRLVDTHHKPSPEIVLTIERAGVQCVLARTQDSLIGELFAPEALTPTRMSLETIDPLAHCRANRVGTAINPLQGSTFHQCRQCLRIQAHRHSDTRPLPHRRTPRARRRQIS